jgi:3-dehydroquinate synthase
MQSIHVNLRNIQDNSYQIIYDIKIYDYLINILFSITTNKQIIIITDVNVAKYHLNGLEQLLKKNHYIVLSLVIKPGEKSKNAKTKAYLEEQMFLHNINRQALLIAFGGGVIGDLTGYLASTYMRGIKYIQIPTTLLAMIDSSIGGKTAINNKYGKNLIGTYYQPKCVIIDTNFLLTIPKKHITNGIIEAIKIFLTFDKEYFYYLHQNIKSIYSNYNILNKIIIRAIELKKHIIEIDEKDKNIRSALNFGHTIGHAIENITQYRILHGYSVALGIIIESRISNKLNKLSNKDLLIIEDLILNKLKMNFSFLSKYKIDDIINIIYLDKKNTQNQINCILLKAIGQISKSKDDKITTTITKDIIIKCFNEF